MPLFQLKRTQRYNVSKKSDCIQTVQLLDETQIECTLTVESIGRECLENVLLRIGVSQPHYFGLRFEAKDAGGGGGQLWRWIDLNKPLKRQLQKRAAVGAAAGGGSASSSSSSSSPTAGAQVAVHLGIQHYALQPHAIADDVTRYQFFLQLRNDVAESRLTCSYEQTILMASYCLQAEFGDHDYARQNVDYVREIEAFEQTIVSRLYTTSAQQQGFLPDIGPHIIDCHVGLAGVAADVAEREYIQMAEQLDGYGLEYCKVKSDQGADAFFGCSPGGVVVRRPDGHVLHYLRWPEIANLTHYKKQLNIEVSSKKKQTTKLIAEHPGLAKYLWKITMLHRQFYLRDDGGSSGGSSGTANTLPSSSKRSDGKQHDGAVGPMPDIQQITLQVEGRAIHESAVDVDFRPMSSDRMGAPGPTAIGDMRPAAVAAVQRASNEDAWGHGYPTPGTSASSAATLAAGAAAAAAASTPPTVAHNQSLVVVSASRGPATPSASRVAATTALPTYRPTPDYETVMKQKLQVQQPSPPSSMMQQQPRSAPVPALQQQQQHHPPSPLAGGSCQRTAASSAAAASVAAATASLGHATLAPVSKYLNGRFTKRSSLSVSQPDVYAAAAFAPASSGPGSGEPLYANISDYVAESRRRRSVNRSSSLVVHATHSQPDVAAAAAAADRLPVSSSVSRPPDDDISQMLLRDYRPPPAYGDKFRSTPDLTSHIVAGAASRVTIGGAGLQLSPDVVSRRYRPATAALPAVALSSSAAAAIKKATSAATAPTGFVPNMSQKQYKSFDNLASIGGEDGDASRDDSGSLDGGGGSRRRTSQTSNDTFHEVDSDDDVDDGLPSSSRSTASNQGSLIVSDRWPPTGAHPNGSGGGSGRTSLTASAVDAAGSRGSRSPSRELASTPRAGQHPIVLPADGKFMAAPAPPALVAAAAVALPAAANGGQRGLLQPPAREAVPTPSALVAEDRFPKDERRRLLEEKLAEKAVFAEYDSVPKKRAKADCKVALQPECAPLNRFPNVLPYEDTRVRLSPRNRNKLGYINASHITVKVGTVGSGVFASAAGEECCYIATQNPQDSTRDDFWQMVWEHNVRIITMASGLEELGQMKCARYWPQEVGPKAAITFDEVLVQLKCSNVSPCFVTHGFKVKHIRTGQSRTVWHVQYTDWPESGCPENLRGFLAYLDEVNSVRLHVQMETSVRGPLVVHCSAGVARTGVVVLCDIMKKCLEYNQRVNVSDVLSQLRQQRMYMVQTSAQYVFCYRVLIEYLKGSRLI